MVARQKQKKQKIKTEFLSLLTICSATLERVAYIGYEHGLLAGYNNKIKNTLRAKTLGNNGWE
jgi:hypothetical protein